MKAFTAFFLCVMVLLAGCSTAPRSGQLVDKTQPLQFQMFVLDSLNENWVLWEGARVDSNGNIFGWELLSFITRANSSAPVTIGPDTYRVYSGSGFTFNWTRSKTGYTGGCGNVPDSCPEHALIRARVGFPSGLDVPAVVFPDNGGFLCMLSNVGGGAVSVIQNCQKSGAEGIVVIFSGD